MRTPPIMRAERTSDGEGRRKKTRGVEASQEGSNEEVFILPFCSCGIFVSPNGGLNQNYLIFSTSVKCLMC
jgi:hypothetical protein